MILNNIWMIGEDYESTGETFINKLINMDLEQFMELASNKTVPMMSVAKNGIATIPINGIIAPLPQSVMSFLGGTSIGELKNSLNYAKNDKKIKGILMPVNSGGGNNEGVDETAHLIDEIKHSKPIYAQTTGVNGSAAYYLTSQATKVFAQNRTNRIGSIGTRLVITDDSEANDKSGVKKIVFDTGKNKSAGHSGTKLTEEQRDYISGMVGELNSYFEDTVKRGRPNIDIKQVNDGSMWFANTAIKKGLIDGVQSIKNTRARLEAASF